MFVHMGARSLFSLFCLCFFRGSVSRVFSVTLGECRFLCWQRGQPGNAGPGEVQITSV